MSDSDKWKLEMKEEMDSLEKNKTWDLVELPDSRKVVGYKWVYKLKKGADDNVPKYKVRLVGKGFSQKAGIDFHEKTLLQLVSLCTSVQCHQLLSSVCTPICSQPLSYSLEVP